MQRNTVLKILNPVLGFLALTQLATGLIHNILPRNVFDTLHKRGGLALAAVIVLHVILNWNWIKANYFRSKV